MERIKKRSRIKWAVQKKNSEVKVKISSKLKVQKAQLWGNLLIIEDLVLRALVLS